MVGTPRPVASRWTVLPKPWVFRTVSLRAPRQPRLYAKRCRVLWWWSRFVGLPDVLCGSQEFGEALQMREQVYGASAYKPVGSTANLAAGTFYVDSVDELHRRSYAQVPPSA